MPEKNVRFTKGAVCSKLTVLSVKKEGYEERYDALLRRTRYYGRKEKLNLAYSRKMRPLWQKTSSVLWICARQRALYFLWFERLLSNHFEGIIAHATYDISAAKIEGINNKIKTLRRQGYGYPDDEYFFEAIRYEPTELREESDL
ncbi:MAG: transposase [Dorea sp.]